MTTPTCHPTRKHYAKGLCKSCYQGTLPKRTAAPAPARVRYDQHQPELARAGNLRRKYGLTPDQYDALSRHQGGACAICGRVPKPGQVRLNVDHDHKTGLVRGLLCGNCNQRVVGNLTVERMRAALAYLEAPPAAVVLGNHAVPSRRRKPRARVTRKGGEA